MPNNFLGHNVARNAGINIGESVPWVATLWRKLRLLSFMPALTIAAPCIGRTDPKKRGFQRVKSSSSGQMRLHRIFTACTTHNCNAKDVDSAFARLDVSHGRPYSKCYYLLPPSLPDRAAARDRAPDDAIARQLYERVLNPC